jgi:hypothetical protein
MTEVWTRLLTTLAVYNQHDRFHELVLHCKTGQEETI